MNNNLIKTYKEIIISGLIFLKPKRQPNNRTQAIKNITYYHLFYPDIQTLLIKSPFTYLKKLKFGIKSKNILLKRVLLSVSI